jgi:hypothetical protein
MISPKDLEAYFKLCSKYEIECLELEGIKIIKKLHKSNKKATIKKVPAPTVADARKITDEQALNMFGPKISLEDFNNFALIPPPDRFSRG